MAKKHRGRPALRAVDVWRWIRNGILNAHQVKQTPIVSLARWKSIRQTWFRRIGEKVVKATAVTYLPKGIFLVPIWKRVPRWEIDHLRAVSDLPLVSRGIVIMDNRYQRLCYMQVEDLDHLKRQQEHVLDQYLDPKAFANDDFETLLAKIAKAEKITRKITNRKKGIDDLSATVEIALRAARRSLRSIADNAPLFGPNPPEKDKLTVSTALEKIAATCRKYPIRPIGTRLLRAARSLDLAIAHIQSNRFGIARARIEAALKNLEYPSPA